MLTQEKAMATPLGSRLKQIRENLGLSRSEVARRADMDPAQLHRLENNDNAAPTFKTVVRLSRVLGVSVNWLAMIDEIENAEIPAFGGIVLDDELRRSIVLASEALQHAIASFTQHDNIETAVTPKNSTTRRTPKRSGHRKSG